MPVGAIIAIVLGSVAVLAGAGVAAYFFILREKIFKKQLHILDRRFSYLHALLIGQDAQYVKRLEIISRTNLLYVDTHTKFLKRFKDIRDKEDIEATESLNELRDLIDAKKFVEFKNISPKVIARIDAYDKLVNDLNDELLKVVKPEEDCRQSALTYKEQLRMIKQDYYSKESELVLMSQTFDEIFKFIDKKFEEFETLVESAQYDEANSILPNIDSILHEIKINMGELPGLCTTISAVLPDKIASVEIAHKDMVSEKYPLYHLGVIQTIEEMKEMIKFYTHKIRVFEIKGLKEKFDEMLKTLDDFFTQFEVEKTSRVSFEEKSEGVYQTVNLIERKFIKLRNTIPMVSKTFVINEEHISKLNDIQSDINKVGALKRSLDTYIHSATKQPYSLLVNKMNELSSASDNIISDIEEYNSYLGSLKADAEEAFGAVFSYYEKLKNAEQKVREINVKGVEEKYKPQFDKMYELLNNIYEGLKSKPINVDAVNSAIHEVHEIGNLILDDGEVAQDFNLMMLAENSITFANRHRNHLSDVDTLVSQAETFFEKGDFENAYVVAGNTLKKIKESNGR